MNLLATKPGRKALFTALYFSEGAPIGYVWWALPTKLRAADVPVEQITALTALVTIPWTLKVLWSPLVDTLRSPRWGYGAWIVTAQLGMGLALVPLIWLPGFDRLGLLAAILVAYAFLSATQDVAIDALCIASVPAEERGAINGWMQVGMLVGRALFGGAILFMEQWWGPRITIVLMILCIWSTAILVWHIPTPPGPQAPAGERRRMFTRFGRTLRRMLAVRATWLGLFFAATGGAAFEAAGALASPILIDHGVDQAQAGVFFALPVVLAMAVGALMGGFVSDRIGRRASVAGTGLLTIGLVVALAILLDTPAAETPALRGLFAVLYLCIGAFTATTYALFMDLTDPVLGATQFSAFMGATNLCEIWAGYTAGRLAGLSGYPWALLVMVRISAAALCVVYWLPRSKAAGGGEPAR